MQKKYIVEFQKKTKFFLGPEYYLINFKNNKIVKNEITIFLGGYPPSIFC